MTTTPIARAYLPITTRRLGAIASADVALNKAQPGSAVFLGMHAVADPPAGATGNAWDLFSEYAVARYRQLGAIVVVN